MTKTIEINGVDCTNWFKEKGYTVGEKRITGSNSGITLAGTQIEDILSIKDVLILPLEPLSEEDICSLMRLLRNSQSAPYVRIYYFSTNYGSYRSAVFLREEVSNKHKFTSSKGVDYYEEKTLEFTEQ